MRADAAPSQGCPGLWVGGAADGALAWSMGRLLFGSSMEEPVTSVQTWPPLHRGPGLHLEPDSGSPRGAEALRMRVGPAPTPPGAEVPLGLQDAKSWGSSCPGVLGPRFHSPSPSGCVSYCPFGAGGDLRAVWAFTWRAHLPPGVRSAPWGGGVRSVSQLGLIYNVCSSPW